MFDKPIPAPTPPVPAQSVKQSAVPGATPGQVQQQAQHLALMTLWALPNRGGKSRNTINTIGLELMHHNVLCSMQVLYAALDVAHTKGRVCCDFEGSDCYWQITQRGLRYLEDNIIMRND